MKPFSINYNIAAIECHFSWQIALLLVASKYSLIITYYFLTSSSELLPELGIEFATYSASEDRPNVNVCVVVRNMLSATTVVQISTSNGAAVGKFHTFPNSLHRVQGCS